VDQREPASLDRSTLRYPFDVTDREWLVLAPLIPPAKDGGRPREMQNTVHSLNSVKGTRWCCFPK
jgi:putative transposase